MLKIYKSNFKNKKNRLEKTRITISFKSKNQLPLLMIIREYYDKKTKEINFAEVLFEIY